MNRKGYIRLMGHVAVGKCMDNIMPRVGRVGGAVRCLRARADEATNHVQKSGRRAMRAAGNLDWFAS